MSAPFFEYKRSINRLKKRLIHFHCVGFVRICFCMLCFLIGSSDYSLQLGKLKHQKFWQWNCRAIWERERGRKREEREAIFYILNERSTDRRPFGCELSNRWLNYQSKMEMKKLKTADTLLPHLHKLSLWIIWGGVMSLVRYVSLPNQTVPWFTCNGRCWCMPWLSPPPFYSVVPSALYQVSPNTSNHKLI